MGVSILIVNYNGSKFLNDCILSFHSQISKYNIEHEFLIIDNASPDNSLIILNKIIEENREIDIKNIDSKENNGFAKGNNILAKYARYDLLILLNNDTLTINIETLCKLIKTNKIAENEVYTSVIYNADRSVQNNLFSYPSITKIGLELFLLKNHILHILPKKTALHKFDYFSGCFLVLTKELYNKIDGFDESFLFYHEECDFFMRLEKVGVVKKILNDTVVHYGSGGGEISEFAFENYYLSLLKLVSKHINWLGFEGTKALFLVGFRYRLLLLNFGININYNPFSSIYMNGTNYNKEKVIRMHKNIIVKVKQLCL